MRASDGRCCRSKDWSACEDAQRISCPGLEAEQFSFFRIRAKQVVSGCSDCERATNCWASWTIDCCAVNSVLERATAMVWLSDTGVHQSSSVIVWFVGVVRLASWTSYSNELLITAP